MQPASNGTQTDRASTRHRRFVTVPPSSWPGLSGPPIAAGAATGGPDKPGHDGRGSGECRGKPGASLTNTKKSITQPPPAQPDRERPVSIAVWTTTGGDPNTNTQPASYTA